MAPPKCGALPEAEITRGGAVSVQVAVPAARLGTPETLTPSASFHAICVPSGENVRLPDAAATGTSQASPMSLGTVPWWRAITMPSALSALRDHSIATMFWAGETSARLR